MPAYKQIIIARKDLAMSPGKLAAQVSHASMAFLTCAIRSNSKKALINCKQYPSFTEQFGTKDVCLYKRQDIYLFAKEAFEKGDDYFFLRPVDGSNWYGELEKCDPKYQYRATITFDDALFEDWIMGTFTKVVCEAKNRNQLLKVIDTANKLGLRENIDYFLIKDNCYTELEPEEIGADGIGRTLTCIGFRPLPAETASAISAKYHLYM